MTLSIEGETAETEILEEKIEHKTNELKREKRDERKVCHSSFIPKVYMQQHKLVISFCHI